MSTIYRTWHTITAPLGNNLLSQLRPIYRFAGLPIAFVAICALLRFSLSPWLGNASPLSLFFLAVMASAIFGGAWTGLITTALALVTGRFFFMDPRHQLTGASYENQLRFVTFSVVGIAVSLMSAHLSKLRRRAEKTAEALRENEARLRGLWDTDVIGVFHWDLDGRVFDANNAYLRITGYSREDLQSGKVNWIEMTPAEHRPNDAHAIDELHARGYDTPFEKEYIRKDGKRIWVQLGGALTKGTRGVSYCLDIHERKVAEQAVRLSEERLRLAGEAAEMGFWTLDLVTNTVTLDATSRRLLGLPVDGEITREMARARVHPDDIHAASDNANEALATGQPFISEFRVVHRDGTQRWLVVKGDAVHDSRGTARVLTGIHWDITARKHAEQERDQLLTAERTARSHAERANRIKDEFLATISHELRTPLNAVLGWAQVLKRTKDRTGMIDEGLDIIERNARTQAKLIEDLLDVSRIISGKVKLDIQALSLSGILNAALESIRPSADLKELNLQVELGETPSLILGDATRLQQVFWNLLNNAVKFTPKKGQVLVRLAANKNRVTVQVKDNGIGMKPAFLEHAFDRFTQADATTTRRFGGLGLGLSIVKHLVELHGGEVSADSDGENLGSTFTVTLPLVETHTPATQEIAEQHLLAAEHSLAGIRVLVVDDESDARTLIRHVLKDTGAVIATVESAEDAITALLANLPDVLISDIGMPGMDGYALLQRIRELPATQGRDIPAIALTAFARPEDRAHALRAGYQLHLPKPINAGELVDSIARLAKVKKNG